MASQAVIRPVRQIKSSSYKVYSALPMLFLAPKFRSLVARTSQGLSLSTEVQSVLEASFYRHPLNRSMKSWSSSAFAGSQRQVQ